MPLPAILGAIGSSGWLGPAAGLLGGIMGGRSSARGQAEANAANERIARENRQFQERMSSTAVTRRMADLKNAGINPILAGKFDASTPAGAMATMGSVGGARSSGAQQGAASVQSVVASGLNAANIRNVNAHTAKTIKETEILGPKHTIYTSVDQLLNKIKGLTTENFSGAMEALKNFPSNTAKEIQKVLRAEMAVYTEWVKRRRQDDNADFRQQNPEWLGPTPLDQLQKRYQ